MWWWTGYCGKQWHTCMKLMNEHKAMCTTQIPTTKLTLQITPLLSLISPYSIFSSGIFWFYVVLGVVELLQVPQHLEQIICCSISSKSLSSNRCSACSAGVCGTWHCKVRKCYIKHQQLFSKSSLWLLQKGIIGKEMLHAGLWNMWEESEWRM